MKAPTPQPRQSYPVDRVSMAAGYRHLADLVESGQAPVPVSPEVSLFLWTVPSEEQAARAVELMDLLGGGVWDKDTDTAPGSLLLKGMCGGLPVVIWLFREAVCERVVTGTETVTVPAQPAVQARTETRDVVEWRCQPLLAAAGTSTAQAPAVVPPVATLATIEAPAVKA